ncbi:toxin [Streptomyces sp. WM4235]|nr:toxin [Streptomyces sp. WM4235]
MRWFKSSYSGSEGDDCVEVAACADTVHVRDSKVTAGPELAVAPAVWTAFLGGVTG